MTADAFIVHLTPRRVRVKIPSKKGDVSFWESVKKQFSDYHGITIIEVNPVTGSALFTHTEDIGMIGKYAQANNLFRFKDLKQDLTNEATTLRQRISKTFEATNNHVKRLTGGNLDVPVTMFLILIGVGIYQISRGNIMIPAWHTAFWYALGMFSNLKPDGD
ncbi:hypothetical protein M1N49_00765 [Thermodesulfovibrionales bacterium]|nr:hypothetical protein [Thermodesulfovibrionales bacterium]MCL0071197.1 hypothetical protein [Thermodesulfovibrionales bacterium]MCL0072204.1 hypothetical protein [Thermodesulfovibrionales bacterium]